MKIPFLSAYLERRRTKDTVTIIPQQPKPPVARFLEVLEAHHAVGFRSTSAWSGPTDGERMGCTIVGPNNQVYRLTVYSQGGYDLNPL
jgi:hypothetical protein